ncbi:MAG: NTP transferase domain-containing protein [Puniceicoccaceae bacterium]
MDKLITGAIILAAGESSRLGYPKQEIEFEGKALLVRSVEALQAGGVGPIVVVLGAKADRIGKLITPTGNSNIHLVMNEYWQTGMGSSIACGMSFLMELRVDLDNVIISLCDQPYLSGEIISQLCNQARQNPDRIAASAYSGTMGPPVVFPKEYFKQLEQCSGEKGARKILKENSDKVETIEFTELAIDIDTPEEHEGLKGPEGRRIIAPGE